MNKNCRRCLRRRHPEHGCLKLRRQAVREMGGKVSQLRMVRGVPFTKHYSGREGRKRQPSRSKSPVSKKRAPPHVADWGEVIQTDTPRLEWRGYADHRAKFEILALSMTQSKLLKPKLKCDKYLKSLPHDVWLKIWEFYKDLDESSEVCRDWPGYCARKWGPRSHERSLNLSDAEQCKRMNWLHMVITFLDFYALSLTRF